MDTWVQIFIVVAAVAIFLQMLILAGMYFAMKKSTQKMEALADEVKTKALPAIDRANELTARVNEFVTEVRPQINSIMGDLSHSTKLVRGHMTRLDATVHDVLDRSRLQIIRADEMVSRTLDKVEETRDAVHGTVMSPIRQLTGVMHGLGVGLGFLFGNRNNRTRRRETVGVPQDEMFI